MNPAECPAGRAAASVDGHVDRVGLGAPPAGQHSTRVAADMQSVLSFRSAKVVLFSTVRFVSNVGPHQSRPFCCCWTGALEGNRAQPSRRPAHTALNTFN